MELSELYKIYINSTGVCTDSRTIQKGQLFFALKGENFDGNQHAKKAHQISHYHVVVDAPTVVENDRFILVDDVLKTLQDLAHYHRKQLDVPVIAITGSNGKTTTKELMANVLAKKYDVLFTHGNLNNHIGVPLTLLAATSDHELLIIEMGANHQGEINLLCEIAAPDYGIINNIGKAHLEGFGGFEGVIKGKTEMYRYLLKHDGVTIVNGDDPVLIEHLPSNLLSFRYFPSDYLLETSKEGFVCLIDPNGNRIETKLVGDYNKANIAAALKIGNLFLVDLENANSAIAEYNPTMNRSQKLVKAQNVFYLDAYNANPTSVLESVKSFDKNIDHSKVLILGDMLELGEESEKEHQSVFDHISNSTSLNQIWLVGPIFSQVQIDEKTVTFSDVKALIDWYGSSQKKVDTHFLVKGSRGIQLEKFVEAIPE